MRLNITKLLGATVSMSIAIAVLVGLYMTLWPVDVLQNWTITTNKRLYQTGETIELTTHFDKVREVTGISKRYIECETPAASTNRIPVSEGEANRKAQTNSNNVIYLRIPTDVPQLPATCHIEIVVEYSIYSFRKHTETTRTPDFTVEQAQMSKKAPPVNPDNDNSVVENAQPNNSPSDVARREPAPSASSPNTQTVPESSSVIPPNDAIVCRIPIVTWLLIQPILGSC